MVDANTESDFQGGAAGIPAGVLKGASTNGTNFIRADQGLNTTDIPVTFPLDASVIPPPKSDKVVIESCGDLDDDDDETEVEEMFVDADEYLGHGMAEWGGPRRGG